jgi:transcription initiation factor TFIID TATA-box-binding protein
MSQMLGNQFNINVENVVASADLHQNIDLESIVRAFPAVEYKPDQFPGLVYRLKKPSAATLVFSTGKLIVAGAKSQNMAKRAVSKLVEDLKGQGIVILAKPDVTIRNVVASAELGHRVDLEDTANILDGTIYEPDQFPGLIYRVKGSKITMLIFSSGKLVCAGATSEVDAEKAVNDLFKTLAEKGLVPKSLDPNI